MVHGLYLHSRTDRAVVLAGRVVPGVPVFRGDRYPPVPGRASATACV